MFHQIFRGLRTKYASRYMKYFFLLLMYNVIFYSHETEHHRTLMYAFTNWDEYASWELTLISCKDNDD